MRPLRQSLLATLAMFVATAGAFADDESTYHQRSAKRYLDLFQWLDRDRDGVVTRLESHGDLNFTPRFDDMDIDRDGSVTRNELDRFVEQQHGSRGLAAR